MGRYNFALSRRQKAIGALIILQILTFFLVLATANSAKAQEQQTSCEQDVRCEVEGGYQNAVAD